MNTTVQNRCAVQTKGKLVELISPHFTFRLDTQRGLRAVNWQNHLTNETLSLGRGSEFETDFDATERRLHIQGWRGCVSHEGKILADRERGYREKFFQPQLDDSSWESSFSPTNWSKIGDRFVWVRTHLFLPKDCQNKRLTLVLGGVGLFDFRFMRVFVNGKAIGTRRISKRWHEPGEFMLRHARFGQDNIIALQLSGAMMRTQRMAELDPQAARALPIFFLYPGQFEQYVRAGNRELRTPQWRVKRWREQSKGKKARVVFELESESKLTAHATYEWSAESPTLHKRFAIVNRSTASHRLLRVRLGTYNTGAPVSDGEQGFPVYVTRGPSRTPATHSFFLTLAHPAGWTIGQDSRIELRQYPGKLLAPGETFVSMETVYGVAESGDARPAFMRQLTKRMRRTQRQHDRPYTIYEPFGSWNLPKGKAFLEDAISERIVLRNVQRVKRGLRETGKILDFYSFEFWADSAGDLTQPARDRFPQGFTRSLRALRGLGTAPALWICSSEGRWSNGANPVMAASRGFAGTWYAPPPDPAFTNNDPRTSTFLCRAAEPAKSIYTNAFRHHIRHNGVRLFKFDGFYPICYNDAHDHLPGIYSTETITNSFIEFLNALDREAVENKADVFLMLYWGHRSPWWLLHGDTLFEPGLLMEAASPAPTPTLYARDGVTQGLDQAQWFCQDVPAIGKDSLGIWLSNWGWNSCIGKERWAEGFAMDLCRGSLLAQPWSDDAWLSPAERKQFARFVKLLRAGANCFRNPQWILGNPWKNEPYGYRCSDGNRTFLAINNCSWQDTVIDLGALMPKHEITARGDARPPTFESRPLEGERPASRARGYSIYRWHPAPARLVGNPTKIALRPFEVVLLEFVPAGGKPSLPENLPAARLPETFDEPSRELRVTMKAVAERTWRLSGEIPATNAGGILAISADRTQHGRAYQTRTVAAELSIQGTVGGSVVKPVPALGALLQHHNSWQTWRIPLKRGATRQFVFTLASEAPPDVKLTVTAHFIGK